MAMTDEELATYLRTMAEPLLTARNMELVDLLCRRQGARRVLQFLVQTPEGVTLDQCAALNRALSDALEAAAALDEPYVLEVASPGLDRPLMTARDFARIAGETVVVELAEPYAGKRALVGQVVSADAQSVTLETKQLGTVPVPLAHITRAVRKLRW